MGTRRPDTNGCTLALSEMRGKSIYLTLPFRLQSGQLTLQAEHAQEIVEIAPHSGKRRTREVGSLLRCR